jgi:hypothetical protein
MEMAMASFKILFQNLHEERDENFSQSDSPSWGLEICTSQILVKCIKFEPICFVIQMEYLKSSVWDSDQNVKLSWMVFQN